MNTYFRNVISFLLVLFLLFPSVGVAADEERTPLNDVLEKSEAVIQETINTIKTVLSDVSNHWAKETIQSLVDRGIINGYGDGTFRPENKINRDEYIKLVIVALGHEFENGKPYWAQPYINKAIELKLIETNSFSKYDTPISRQEMTSIIVKGAYISEDVPASDYDKHIPNAIGDFESIIVDYRDEVIDSYRYGLITGKKPGVFDPNGYSTRAEASTVIARLLDSTYRNPYSAYVENHLAMETGELFDMNDPYLAYPFFEEKWAGSERKPYDSPDKLFIRIKETRELAAKIKVTIDHENEQYVIVIPQHNKNDLGIIVGGMSHDIQFENAGTYHYYFKDARKDNGYLFGLKIIDMQRGGNVLYDLLGYSDNDSFVLKEGSVAQNDIETNSKSN